MSRKKTVTPTASLASCLDFAARILSSTASVQEICTKSVLAPMVVEAHRCGQQVAKNSECGSHVDVRKLLKTLQSKESNKLCRQSPLQELEVADLTWDFNGTVEDTLSIEIEELEDRAAMSETDTCIVLSASSQTAGGQAVIWFPLDCSDDVGDRRKRQILLYVCPGRVKVVKSVGDLIKKMYEELPILRENGSTYNVWAVIMGAKSYNQQEEERDSIRHEVAKDNRNQHKANSVLKSSNSSTNSTSVRPSASDSNQIHLVTRSTDSKRFSRDFYNQKVTDNQSGAVVDDEDTIRDDELDQDKFQPVSLRFSGYRDITDMKPYLTKSIFSFGGSQKNSVELQRRSSERMMDNSAVTEENTCTRDAVIVECDVVNPEAQAANATSSGDKEDLYEAVARDEMVVQEDNQRQNPRPKPRRVVSSSLSKFTNVAKEENFKTETGLGLGGRLQQGFAWQSCDGKVLRKTILGQRRKQTDDEPNENERTESRGGDEDDTGVIVEAQSDEVDAGNEEVHDEGLNDLRGNDNTEVKKDTNGELRSDEVQTQRDSHEQLPIETLIQVTETENNTMDSSRIFTLGSEPSANQAEDLVRSVDKKADSSSVTVPHTIGSGGEESTSEKTMDRSKESNIPDSREERISVEQMTEFVPESPVESDKAFSIQKRNTVVNYRDKLGARIWWELEYTAKRLEREEMMERQQQAHQKQAGIQQRKRVTSRSSRRVGPIGLPKNHQSVKQRGLEAVANSNGCSDQQSSDKLNTTDVPESTQHAHSDAEHSLSNMTNGKNSLRTEAMPPNADLSPYNPENEILPCKTVSPTRSQQSIVSTKPSERFERVESSSMPTKRNDDYTPPASLVQELHKQKEEAMACATPAIYPDASQPLTRSNASERGSQKSYEERQPSRTSLSKHVAREPLSTARPVSLKSTFSNQLEDDDEALTQMMWGSTHTNYEREHNAGNLSTKEDEMQTSEIASVPFTVRGRVPIRSRSTPATAEPSSSSSNEHSPSSDGSNHEVDGSKLPTHTRPPRHQASTNLAVTTPASVATFIALGEEKTATTSAKSREERLKELRQKKLQKLQQARDSSLQQKEKLQRQVHRPLSFSNANYTKKASNRQLMQNALEFTLLAGGSMERERTLALQALAESPCDNFIVLLKSAKELKFRALYENHVDRDFATRIFSLLPSNSSRAPLKLESSEMISQFFKYSSAKKQFLPVPTRSFTVKTDACALVDHLVFKGKPGSALARLL
ncbi:hypothetical protein F441_10881 [Phytophthora nicotianae CJ01A1]|uniref:CKK domain-containing protein n=1 Tax=Phytophthora nicotianae CJ01A1 TaxID=1317063 RepID=W2WUF5_PHYNI|nr:hypothetical protein F441_10881 [Phytophthora nicotianae CJ01A1]